MNLPDFNKMTELNIGLLLFAALVTIFLLIGSMIDKNRNRPFMKRFIYLLVFHIVMLFCEAAMRVYEGISAMIPLTELFFMLSFCFSYVVVAFYAYCLVGFVKEREDVSWKYAHIIALLCIVPVLLSLVSTFNGMLFYFDAEGWLRYTKWYPLINLFDQFIFMLEILLVVKYRKQLTSKGVFSLLTFCLLPLFVMPLSKIWDTTPIYLASTLSLIVLYMLFHGELTRQLAEKEKQLSESRIAIMVSQIQPHFLYNALNSIYHLCGKDKDMAQQAISDFSDYLRMNLKSLDYTGPIPFTEELKHVKAYLHLEKMRFEEELNIVYDIGPTGFQLPALTVQPIMENAIKHGIFPKSNGGTVKLATRETSECYEIMISDNGVGFRPGDKKEDGKSHIGIRNVRQRLEEMCGAELEISSILGVGTKVTIRIPKESQKFYRRKRVRG